MTGRVLLEKADGIAWITLDHAQRRNALTLEMWGNLHVAAKDAEADPAVRVVVLAGAGDKAFTSGADISEFSKVRSNAEQKQAYGVVSGGAQQALWDLSKPLIAMVRGYCVGGGLALALAADVRIAARGAKFGIPAAKLGAGYDYHLVAALARLVGPSATKDILFSGRLVEADEASRLGIANFVHDPAELDAGVRAYAGLLAGNAPLSLVAMKAAVCKFETYSDAADARDIAEVVERCFNSHDYREGWQAFLEKRQPQFRGC